MDLIGWINSILWTICQTRGLLNISNIISLESIGSHTWIGWWATQFCTLSLPELPFSTNAFPGVPRRSISTFPFMTSSCNFSHIQLPLCNPTVQPSTSSLFNVLFDWLSCRPREAVSIMSPCRDSWRGVRSSYSGIHPEPASQLKTDETSKMLGLSHFRCPQHITLATCQNGNFSTRPGMSNWVKDAWQAFQCTQECCFHTSRDRGMLHFDRQSSALTAAFSYCRCCLATCSSIWQIRLFSKSLNPPTNSSKPV